MHGKALNMVTLNDPNYRKGFANKSRAASVSNFREDVRTASAHGNSSEDVSSCQRFTIRGYVSKVREQNVKRCWPFKLKNSQTAEGLPPMEVPEFKFWKCKYCVESLVPSASTPVGVERRCMHYVEYLRPSASHQLRRDLLPSPSTPAGGIACAANETPGDQGFKPAPAHALSKANADNVPQVDSISVQPISLDVNVEAQRDETSIVPSKTVRPLQEHIELKNSNTEEALEALMGLKNTQQKENSDVQSMSVGAAVQALLGLENTKGGECSTVVTGGPQTFAEGANENENNGVARKEGEGTSAKNDGANQMVKEDNGNANGDDENVIVEDGRDGIANAVGDASCALADVDNVYAKEDVRGSLATPVLPNESIQNVNNDVRTIPELLMKGCSSLCDSSAVPFFDSNKVVNEGRENIVPSPPKIVEDGKESANVEISNSATQCLLLHQQKDVAPACDTTESLPGQQQRQDEEVAVSKGKDHVEVKDTKEAPTTHIGSAKAVGAPSASNSGHRSVPDGKKYFSHTSPWQLYSKSTNIFREISNKMKEREVNNACLQSTLGFSTSSCDDKRPQEPKDYAQEESETAEQCIKKTVQNVPSDTGTTKGFDLNASESLKQDLLDNTDSYEEVQKRQAKDFESSLGKHIDLDSPDFVTPNPKDVELENDSKLLSESVAIDRLPFQVSDSQKESISRMALMLEKSDAQKLSTEAGSSKEMEEPNEQEKRISKKASKVKVSDRKGTRKPQKMRSLSDIIASQIPLPNCYDYENYEETFLLEHESPAIENSLERGKSEMPHLKEDSIRVSEKALNFDEVTAKGTKKAVNFEEDIVKASKKAWKKKAKHATETVSPLTKEDELEHNSLQSEKSKKKKKKRGIELQLKQSFQPKKKRSSHDKASLLVTNDCKSSKEAAKLPSESTERTVKAIHNEDGQSSKNPEMEEEIPMDIVELMAKNQMEREQALSSSKPPKKRHKSKKTQKPGNIEVMTKNNNKTRKVRKGDPKQCASSSKSKTTPDNPAPSNTFSLPAKNQNYASSAAPEALLNVECNDTSMIGKDFLARLQSPSNDLSPRGKHVLCGLPSIDGVRMDASPVKHKECASLPIAGDPLKLKLSRPSVRQELGLDNNETRPVTERRHGMLFQTLEQSDPVKYFNEIFPNAARVEDTMREGLTPERSRLNYDASLEGSSIQSFLGKANRDTGGSLYFNVHSNSALLQQVNDQARKMIQDKSSLTPPPVLRLMGHSLTVPVSCCSTQDMLQREHGSSLGRSNLSLPLCSVQTDVNLFNPSACTASFPILQKNHREIHSANEIIPTLERIQEQVSSYETNNECQKTICGGFPNFNMFENFTTVGHTGTPNPIGGNLDGALKSLQWKASGGAPFERMLSAGAKEKSGLTSSCKYSDKIGTFFDIFSNSKNTEMCNPHPDNAIGFYGSSSTTVQTNVYENSTFYKNSIDEYLNRQSSRPSRVIPEFPIPTKSRLEQTSALSKEDRTILSGYETCNVEICTLNRNPAEMLGEEDEAGYSGTYECFGSLQSDTSQRKRKKGSTVSGRKQRATSSKKRTQDIDFQKDADGLPSLTSPSNIQTLWTKLAPFDKLESFSKNNYFRP